MAPKFGFVLTLTIGSVLFGFVACGGNPELASKSGFLPEAGAGGESSDGSGGSSRSSAGASSDDPDITIDGGDPCDPDTCKGLGAECGTIADGCGDVLDCGECDDGEACGIETRNVCTNIEDLCEPVSESDACEGKECGLVGDGCSGTYDCGTCGADESCGTEEAFQCGPNTVSIDPGDCMNPIGSCEEAGARCGVIGDGCGGTIDCIDELGPCPDGTYCGIRQPYQCDAPPPPDCDPSDSCADLGWECGVAIDDCGNVFDCADEGRVCGDLEVCVGGIDSPTECLSGTTGPTCELCGAVPVCSGNDMTTLTGRVITPGRTDSNTGNQVGVPNAFVYILRTNDLNDVPDMSEGIPNGGTSCDRCDEQELGPVLAGSMTDATGAFTLEENIPVDTEFLLIVKVGKFRRAVRMTLPADAACEETALPTAADVNPTRLPRDMSDGLVVNIPKVAVTTGQLDAMECVFEKIGIDHAEFGNPGNNGSAAERIHIYRGGSNNGNPPGAGARIDNNTPHDSELYGSLTRMQLYDMIVADCEGPSWDGSLNQRDADGDNVREYVNRGGRMFASHLSHTWLIGNGNQAYSAADPIGTGLGPSASYTMTLNISPDQGTGIISLGRPNASPRINNFRDWMVNEGVTTAPDYEFTINEPRSQVTAIGSSSEEFVHCDGGDCSGNTARPQQFSFNTPYGAPAAAACGRVAYSGFHVVTGNSANAVFPNHCSGNLTDQEKVLLYMIFDLGVCVGEEPTPPSCTPLACPPDTCGLVADGCGGVNDCGPCEPPPCVPTDCEEQNAECGAIGDGCGEILQCGDCQSNELCGAINANQCDEGQECTPMTCNSADIECGLVGDGCGDIIDCGDCPQGEFCGILTPFQCDPPPPCIPIDCDDVGAECGIIADGCGSTVDCGACPSGEICGLDELNQCASVQ